MKVSVVNLIGWLAAVIGLTFTISSAYGEQKQKMLYLSTNQAAIELKLDRVEVLQRDMNLAIARIETEIKDRSKK